MNDQQKSSENDPLRRLLHEWHVEAATPPRFAEGVWRRIEREQPAEVSPWTALGRWLSGWLARPVFASAYVALLLAAGLAVGFFQAEDKVEHDSAQQRSQYLQSVNPYFVAAHHAAAP